MSDYFSRGLEKAFAKAVQRRLTAQTNQTKQDSRPVVKQTSAIITEPVINKQMTDDEYRTSLLSKMKAHLKAKQQITDTNQQHTIN